MGLEAQEEQRQYKLTSWELPYLDADGMHLPSAGCWVAQFLGTGASIRWASDVAEEDVRRYARAYLMIVGDLLTQCGRSVPKWQEVAGQVQGLMENDLLSRSKHRRCELLPSASHPLPTSPLGVRDEEARSS